MNGCMRNLTLFDHFQIQTKIQNTVTKVSLVLQSNLVLLFNCIRKNGKYKNIALATYNILDAFTKHSILKIYNICTRRAVQFGAIDRIINLI